MKQSVIRFGDDKENEFVLSFNGWQGKDKQTVDLLNTLYPYPDENYEAYDPNPLARIAQLAADELGAAVVELAPTDDIKGVIF